MDLIDKLNQLENIQSVSDNGDGSFDVHLNGANVTIRDNDGIYEMLTHNDVVELGQEDETVEFFRGY